MPCERDHFHGHQPAMAYLTAALAPGEALGRQAGGYLRQFRRSHSLELGDAIIAATAAQAGADLVTRNLKHYPMADIQVTPPYERGRR